MQFHRSIRGAVSVALATTLFASLSACGSDSTSSDSTIRSRNSTLDLTSPATVALYVGPDSGSIPRFYTASLAAGGTVTGTELFSDKSGYATGVVGISYDSTSRTVYWITQEGHTAYVRSRQLDSTTTNTLYTYANTIPYGIGYDAVNNKLVWTGVESGSGKVWVGDPLGSPATNPISTGFNAMSVSANTAYGVAGTAIDSYVLSPVSRQGIAGGIGTDSWAVIADETNSKVYYTVGYSTTSLIKQKNSSGSGSAIDYVTPMFAASQLAMKSNGALVWTNGSIPGYAPPSRNSGINVVDPDDTLTSLTFNPSPAVKISALWLIEAPQTDVDPQVSGSGGVGSEYNCDDASWAVDLPAQMLSRAPELGRTYAWYLDGTLIDGETGGTYTATTVGNIKCSVTASNLAGSTTVESNEVTVTPKPEAGSETAAPESSAAETSTTSSTAGSVTTSPATAISSTIASIKVKWTFISSSKMIKGTFTKVSGASSYAMSVTGATKKSGRCKTVKTKVTCTVFLKKGSNNIVVKAKNAAKTVVAQKSASKRVR